MNEGELNAAPRRADYCERCHLGMPQGYCPSCENEELEIGGWEGSISLGARRVNHFPQD